MLKLVNFIRRLPSKKTTTENDSFSYEIRQAVVTVCVFFLSSREIKRCNGIVTECLRTETGRQGGGKEASRCTKRNEPRHVCTMHNSKHNKRARHRKTSLFTSNPARSIPVCCFGRQTETPQVQDPQLPFFPLSLQVIDAFTFLPGRWRPPQSPQWFQHDRSETLSPQRGPHIPLYMLVSKLVLLL